MKRTFQRRHALLTDEQLAELVRRRDAGETWTSIGFDLGKQDGVLKRAYDRAKADALPMAA